MAVIQTLDSMKETLKVWFQGRRIIIETKAHGTSLSWKGTEICHKNDLLRPSAWSFDLFEATSEGN
jgi:hypothetical protein